MWHLVSQEELDQIINDYFAQSHKLKMQGKVEESMQVALKASRLQGTMSKTKPIQVDVPKEAPVPKRGDTFMRKVFRNDEPTPEQ